MVTFCIKKETCEHTESHIRAKIGKTEQMRKRYEKTRGNGKRDHVERRARIRVSYKRFYSLRQRKQNTRRAAERYAGDKNVKLTARNEHLLKKLF